MAKRPLFLKWLLINTLVLFGLIFVGIEYWSAIDALGSGPKFALGVIATYAFFSAYVGRLMWEADYILEERETTGWLDTEEDAYVEELLHDNEHVWFGVGLLPMLGMVGTVTGFLIVMISGFGHLHGQITPQDVSALVQSVGNGSGTALTSTLAGILGSLLLAVQHHFLDHALAELTPGVQEEADA